eukprot:2043869-Pyramimonas_sp.AAC.1
MTRCSASGLGLAEGVVVVDVQLLQQRRPAWGLLVEDVCEGRDQDAAAANLYISCQSKAPRSVPIDLQAPTHKALLQ